MTSVSCRRLERDVSRLLVGNSIVAPITQARSFAPENRDHGVNDPAERVRVERGDLSHHEVPTRREELTRSRVALRTKGATGEIRFHERHSSMITIRLARNLA